MRDVRMHTDPLPDGRGFCVPRGRARPRSTRAFGRAALTVVVVVLASMSQARAADVTVSFGLSAATYLPTGALCAVHVPEGADGVAVLDAAVDAGCIESYEAQDFGSLGTFVSCINRICGQFQATPAASVGTFWALYVDGEPSMTGVSSYEAADGSEIVFAYEAFAF